MITQKKEKYLFLKYFNMDLNKEKKDIDANWKINQKSINRDFKFENFKQALDFMNKVGKFCETINHHPNWYNAYNLVKIELTTHDLGGLSNLDFKLAKKIDTIYSSFGK